MKFSIGATTGILAASSILLALLCITRACAQDADESGIDAAEESPQEIPGYSHTGPVPPVFGTWTGTDTYVDGGGQGSGSMTLDLTQNVRKIRGTFSLTTSGDETATGSVTGKITNTGRIIKGPATLILTFHQTNGHHCTAAVVATIEMSGTFLFKGNKTNCSAKGTFDLQKQ
ncbi:MAG TPA: hypothetical protein VJX23_13845 [Candidatus Binataceae bacterium]|nr:hypothetical protein [Candidatus Binataceae bacterium]